jgi:hypothetical protein
MPFEIGPDQILQASVNPRWSALTTVGGIAADLQNYDAFLLRDPRLLVPVDLQALVVRAGVNDTEPMVRLPFRTDDPGSYPPLDVHDVGAPRPPGVSSSPRCPTAGSSSGWSYRPVEPTRP